MADEQKPDFTFTLPVSTEKMLIDRINWELQMMLKGNKHIITVPGILPEFLRADLVDRQGYSVQVNNEGTPGVSFTITRPGY